MPRNYFSGMSGGWVVGSLVGWLAGLFGNITNSAPNWVGAWAELGNIQLKFYQKIPK